MRDLFVSDVTRNSVATMFAAVALVLLAACANIAGLLVARVKTAGSLGSGARSAGPTADQRRFQSVLVAAQIAVSLVLIVGAALLSRSVMRLQDADAGFDPAPLASLRFYIAGDAYDDPAARAAVIARVVDRLSALPGVAAAAVTGSIPADDGAAVVRVETDLTGDAAMGIGASVIPVNPAFWDTLGLRLGEGRTFTEAEAADPETQAVIVGRRLAARLWPGQPAVDRVFHVRDQAGRHAYRVVGVSPDLVYEELGEETEQSQLVFYVPHAGRPYRTLAALLRVEGDPASVLQPARAAVRAVDPSFAAFDTLTMANRRNATLWGERFIGSTFGLFAIMALLLACLGTYGLTAYSAAQRAREIGVRLAIGATRPQILRLLLTRGARLAVAGALAGLPLAALAARGMRGMLYDMTPWDPVLWLSMPLVLVAAVLVASYVPAHRASGADPARALRAD
jgi:predicted permease